MFFDLIVENFARFWNEPHLEERSQQLTGEVHKIANAIYEFEKSKLSIGMSVKVVKFHQHDENLL